MYPVPIIVGLRDEHVSHTVVGGWVGEEVEPRGCQGCLRSSSNLTQCSGQAGLPHEGELQARLESGLSAGAELGGGGEVALGIACSSAWLLRPPPTQTPPLLAGAGPPGQAGAALRQADKQQDSGVPPLKLGLTSLDSSPETGLTGSD